MEPEKKKIPEWLQDKKKALILGIVILALIASAFSTFLIGNKLFSYVYTNVLGMQPIKITVTSLVDQLLGKSLVGQYENNYADETIIFNANGTLDYFASSYYVQGTYKINGKVLQLVLGDDVLEFDILQHDGKVLEFSNGFTTYSFTKVDSMDF